jgi:predicted DNA-binding transcriptional regulator AlpA
MTRKETIAAGDELVPEAQVLREFGVSAMTFWRWDRDPALNFPPPVKIRGRKFRYRAALETFKRRLLADAIAQRSVPTRREARLET